MVHGMPKACVKWNTQHATHHVDTTTRRTGTGQAARGPAVVAGWWKYGVEFDVLRPSNI